MQIGNKYRQLNVIDFYTFKIELVGKSVFVVTHCHPVVTQGGNA
jgi:hypothetical protein